MRFWFSISCVLFLLISTVADAKIVFSAGRNGVTGIYIMDDNGANMTLLTDTLEPFFPRFSPDGKHIVFDRQVNLFDDQRLHLFLMNVDGTDVRQLTVPHAGMDSQPSFSPDGKSILFLRYEIIDDRNRKDWLCVMDLESSKIEHISDFDVQEPDWSPDGKQIVCTTVPVIGRTGGNIWIMDADGRNARELLPLQQVGNIITDRARPRWSPDGKQIVFLEDQHRFERIDGVLQGIPEGYYYYIYTLSSGKLQKLNIRPDFRPASIAWMDNGKSVLFTAGVRKLKRPIAGAKVDYNTYKYHLATGKITQLTDHPDNEYILDWISDDVLSVSPVGKKKTILGTLKQ